MPRQGLHSASPPLVEIVIPARNVALRLPDGLAALCRKAATLPLRTAIVVVNSASTDPTGDIVRGWPAGPVPVRLVQCDRAGKGLAVQAGLLATRAPFVGFCDADMATDLSALDVAVSLLTRGNPLVIGSRMLDASVVEDRHSGIRRIGATTFRALARRIVPDATDTQCGFKFFSGPLARAAARASGPEKNLNPHWVSVASGTIRRASARNVVAPIRRIPLCLSSTTEASSIRDPMTRGFPRVSRLTATSRADRSVAMSASQNPTNGARVASRPAGTASPLPARSHCTSLTGTGPAGHPRTMSPVGSVLAL